jgi:hypothetical protein
MKTVKEVVDVLLNGFDESVDSDISESYIECIPAYGRDYKSKKEVQTAWDNNHDFMIVSMDHPHRGRYVNKQDVAGSGHTMMLRFKRNTGVHVIKT